MENQNKGIIAYFSNIDDPRINRRKRHLLLDIMVISVCAVIGGAEGWQDIELYGNAKFAWFKTFLALPNGIPSHDTFARVLSIIDADQFQKSFAAWTQAVVEVSEGRLIAIDGKSWRFSG